MADKYQMEFIKMFKRMINSLKYTQSSICFAYAKDVRFQFKVFDNNLIRPINFNINPNPSTRMR